MVECMVIDTDFGNILGIVFYSRKPAFGIDVVAVILILQFQTSLKRTISPVLFSRLEELGRILVY